MSFLRNLFVQNEYIDCPRCLLEIAIAQRDKGPNKVVTCSECDFKIPPEYINRFRDAYPVFIQLFGWSAVGKTTFLDVLRLMLYMHPIWPRFTCDPITRLDFDHKAILLHQRRNGHKPDSTQARDRDQNMPYIMILNDMDRWQSRFLIMMDHAGEQFQRFTVPEGEIPFLQHCPTTIMLYSLNDREPGKQIEDLMITYTTSLTRYGVDFSKTPRKLVMVLAKGDTVTQLPPNIMNYLNSDDTWTQLEQLQTPIQLQDRNLSAYIEVMGRVSDALKEWFINNVPGTQQFNTIAERNGIEVRYAIISAQGQEIDENMGAAQIRPKRVLDPFFWALEFQSK
ncbi:MAG: hypothetical protein M9928_11055 [Anaerolineae bacterium]|nr:hypothetical protein [Anaerolineae bacterium]MCO5205563.1 hypothetical protein [Anaerolineae bacterium]